jgi:hypothetical protein
MQEVHETDSVTGDWPRLEDLVPPELPPEVAVARLVALARSLLAENRQLREILHTRTDGVELMDVLHPTDRGAAA